MARTPFAAALALLLIVCSALVPHTAAAIVIFPRWALAGWNYYRDLGNLDSDPQHELLVYSKADARFALVDALSGVIEQQFPEFKYGEADLLTENIDSDPRLEIVLARVASLSGPLVPLTRAYDWTAGGYVTLFTHADPVTSVGLVRLRSTGQVELLEQSSNDVRVRDMSGTVLLQASTAVSPWSGVEPSVLLLDLDADGINELGIMQNASSSNNQTLFFDYNAGFVYTWSATSWFMVGTLDTDGDAQAEVLAFNRLDGRFVLFDGLSGTTDLELPEFTIDDNANVFGFDVDGDGRDEVYASRPAGPGVTPLVRAYDWVSGSYVPMFSHSQEELSSAPAHTRNAAQFEFINATSNDLVIRDAVAGTVLFRASTQIAGWSGTNLVVNPVDLDHDGVLEFIVQDNTTARIIRYTTGAYTQLWSSTAWKYPYMATKLDDNPLDGLFAIATSDEHYGLLDPFTGAVRKEFPTFFSSQSYTLPVDFDRDGRNELLMIRNAFNVTPFTTCYRWDGSEFLVQFRHTDGQNGLLLGAYRPTVTNDLLEVGYANGQVNDLRVRAFDGSVIWRASTDVPGWTGVDIDGGLDTLDVDQDGVVEFMAIDNAAIRLMQYVGALSVDGPGDGAALRLSAGTPNPFRTSTTLRFSTQRAGDVAISVFDTGGRVVWRRNQHFPAGSHEVKWDGRDETGRPIPEGVLFYDVRTAGEQQTRKLVRIGR